MDFIQAIITGIVQGLTEFLPVSSSGHLVLTSALYSKFTGKPFSSGSQEEIFFDIMLHFGTLVAILIYFREDIIKLVKSFFYAVKNKSFKGNYEAQTPLYIAIATLATAAVVIPFKDMFEADMNNPPIVGIQIAITGILLLITEFMSTRMTSVFKRVNWKNSIIIGIAQGIAVSPGISRSGSTIAAGLAIGLDRVSAAKFSFLMSIPIIILAVIFDVKEQLGAGNFHALHWPQIIVGTVVSAIVGYYCIKYFITYLSNHKLTGFAYYCLTVGFLMFFFLK